ncbi:myelin regulatory factor-like protein isoform X3 [Salmo salar]|uniref:Myelin regulatory factor-like protein isoform X2 n=1 Tax=Salmo salar TaxID=8030 RepID=A0ABM3DBK4_SALSA|nr:myelin regulatory factor-like protein isoform X2 [Salmo salar]XP_045556192.1 myelin regulatory factor-like protein isoform X3 [Salmo salar]
MEPPGGLRVPIDVLGENEALQQFFDGCQDMSGVLESAVVDTSILEQYLSNDMDPTFMLPESPPDSGSEPCSPPQIPDVSYGSQEVFQPVTRPPASSCRYKEQAPQPPPHPGLPYHQGLTNSYTKAGTSPGSLPHHPHYLSPGEGYIQANTAPTAPVHHKALQQHQPPPRQGLADSYPRANAPPVPELPPGQAAHLAPGLGLPSSCLLPVPGCPSEPGYSYLPPTAGQHTGLILPDCKKRRRTEPLEVQNHLVAVPIAAGSESAGGDVPSYDSDGAIGSSSGMGAYQLLSWDRYQPGLWTTLYNSNYDILPSPGYHVDTDKGFNYSTADESFVCQKKNHFQVTVHVGMAGDPLYVKTPNGPAPIDSFQVKVFGVKLEAQTHKVTIEQSQPDRSKKPFLPVKVSLPGDRITRVTLGRLHFSDTTANNMRKKGKPNPDQRYFLMVVGLYATVREESYLLIAYMSERIIVRASNPGQFENDSEVLWQRGQAPDAVVCQGRVGINTDTPDEALVVCGNAKIMGQVMHPSDRRAKHNIQEVDSTEQLKRISQMRIVEYDYKPEFASEMGIDHIHETGIIAQEVKELLPTAVKEVGDITCSDGEKIHNFLMVDKEQIFMENVGAVKQLCKLTDNLENRIQELEVWNTRLAKLKNMGSLRSSSNAANSSNPAKSSNPANSSTKRKMNRHNSVPPPQKPTPLRSVKAKFHRCLKHKFVQVSMIILVATIAFCSIAITALYMLTLRDDTGMLFPGSTNETTVHPLSTTTVRPTLGKHPLSTTTVRPTLGKHPLSTTTVRPTLGKHPLSTTTVRPTLGKHPLYTTTVRPTLGKHPLSTTTVRPTLGKHPLSTTTVRPTLGKHPLYTTTVRPTLGKHPLYTTTVRPTLGKHPLSTTTVRPTLGKHPLSTTTVRPTLGKHPLSTTTVRPTLGKHPLSTTTVRPTLGKHPLSTTTVRPTLGKHPLSTTTVRPTLGKHPLSTTTVRPTLGKHPLSTTTVRPTLGKHPLSTTTVRPTLGKHPLSTTTVRPTLGKHPLSTTTVRPTLGKHPLSTTTVRPTLGKLPLYTTTVRPTLGKHPLSTTTVRPTLVNPTTTPVPWTPDVDFCSLIYCEEVFCCPTTASMDNTSTISPALLSSTVSPNIGPSLADKGKDKFNEEIKGAGDWTNTTIRSFFIKENEQMIDSRYCERGRCGSGNYSFQIPISKFVPTNMRVTVQMNTTELLVVHLCHHDETFKCSALMDHDQTNEDDNFINTQGYVHEWPLPVSRFYSSSYHFRSAVAGQADCSTDRGFVGALFTDYHFNFYRRCE